MVAAVALDLGTTRVKAALVDESGRLARVEALDAPAPRGSGRIREVDPVPYLAAAEAALLLVREGLPEGVPLGVACQRSSFLVWESVTGAPQTPIVSWQDRRAATWCREREALDAVVRRRTGLLLSPHYFAPKLAMLTEESAELRDGLRQGKLRTGTLDSWLIATWSGGQAHRTDPTLAARTLLIELGAGDWSPELLDAFGLLPDPLPAVTASAGAPLELPERGTLQATLSDQASSLLAVSGGRTDVAVVNLGTGCFVLRPTGATPDVRTGYLAGPVLHRAGDDPCYALEGTINAGGAVADRFAPGPTKLPEEDPTPEAWCLPDEAGTGAPHWRPDVSLVWSEGSRGLDRAGRRRVFLEGLLFRVREILDDLSGPDRPAVCLSGGLARDPFVRDGLAACLGRTVAIVDEPEGTLAGVGRLAAGLPLAPASTATESSPGSRGGYLRGKYERWRKWLPGALGAAKGTP